MRLLKTGTIIRNLYGQTLLENFLVTGVASILGIRVYLQLTGYPQVGGTHFHVAHMLYGGILMLLALFILFAFLNRTAIYFASIVGGIGFGFFIDEVGKFITRDNNYFFHPSFAIIYAVFITVYLASEALPRIRQVSRKEYLVNALDLMKEVVIQDLDTDEKKLVLSYLKQSDPSDPLVPELRRIVNAYRSKPSQGNLYTDLTAVVLRFVRFLSNSTGFYRVVIILIGLNALFYLVTSLIVLASVNRSAFIIVDGFLFAVLLYLVARFRSLTYFFGLVTVLFLLLGINFLSQQHFTFNVTFTEAATFLSSLVAGIIALLGILQLPHSRERGLSYIRLSLLVSIFLTQFFRFYSEQLSAVVGLGLDLLMLVTVETVLRSVRLQKMNLGE